VTDSRATPWTWLAYGYAALVVCVVGYGLLGMPVQVSDSLNNIIQASRDSLAWLVYNNFWQRGYLSGASSAWSSTSRTGTTSSGSAAGTWARWRCS
jgi:hypothetical protein